MIEDDIYRTSSQYRYWSYTQEALTSLRHTTHELASERVRVAIRRSKDAKKAQNELNNSANGNSDAQESAVEIETLTINEELKLVRWGCSMIIEMGQAMEPPIPTDVRATAIQYLRRFYLTNSPMTYHPKQIMTCALFLATKSDHWHISLSNFVSKLSNVTEDDVKAPEFLLMQGIRFTLDVRHPMRGLEGGVGEVLAMVDEGLLGPADKDKRAANVRVGTAADRANNLLRNAAQMTDAYFFFTPSQIWLSAMLAADQALTTLYLNRKLAHLGAGGVVMREKLLKTLNACADLLKSYKPEDADPTYKKDMKRIGRKLLLCQNPEKVDLVAVTKAKAAEKREGADGGDVDKALKKRKLEREKLERDGDVFGPALKVPNG